MTLVRRCTIALPVLFWQLVNLSVFGYACAFLFWPDDTSKLFLVAPDKELIRFLGVQYLLVAAGCNQMVATVVGGSSAVQKSAFATSMFEYLLAGIAGVVVLSMKEEPFIEEQRYAFIVLYSLFVAALFTGLCCNCGAYCVLRTKNGNVQTLETVQTEPSFRRSALPASRAEIYKNAGR
tara:strand:+ start:253 stop:789 length:537 start_codon:yes stop_codon:yes gene_type:complete